MLFNFSIANSNDKLDIHELLLKLRAMCHPTQERVFCNQANKKQIATWKSKGLNYVCNPVRPIGKDTLGKLVKSLAKQCNFKNWEKVTNQNGR